MASVRAVLHQASRIQALDEAVIVKYANKYCNLEVFGENSKLSPSHQRHSSVLSALCYLIVIN